MKAEELMIGDWVHVLGEDCKIVSLSPIDVIVQKPSDDSNIINMASKVPEHYVAPILLTLEILEKNGFAKVFLELAYNLPDYRSDIWFFPSTDYFYFGFDGTAAQFNCQYVHELQHALKLCGIEKEIIV